MTADDVMEAQSLLSPIGSLRDVVFDLTGGDGGGGGDPGGGTFFGRSDAPDSIERETATVRGRRQLVGVRLETSRRIGHRTATAKHRISIRHLGGRRNAARDSARLVRRAGRPTGIDFADCSPMFGRYTQNTCTGTSPGGAPGGPPPCFGDSFRVHLRDTSATDNLVLQHGIWSDACTWETTRPVLLDEFRFGKAIESRTAHQEGYWSQQQQLRDGLEATRGSSQNFVFVGHSQGGVIARLAAQQLPASMVRGIITVHSPNNGALVAEPLRGAAAAGVVIGAVATATSAPPVAAALAGLAALAPLLGDYRCELPRQAICDAQPGSGTLQQVNSAPNQYRTVAIIGQSRQDLVLLRLGGDNFNKRGVGGRDAVRKARQCRIYCTGVGALLLFVPGANVYGSALLKTVGVVTAADLSWRLIYSNNQGGDGFINQAGQPAYGDSISRIFVTDADSHLGAHYGADRGVLAMQQALRLQLRVPTR